MIDGFGRSSDLFHTAFFAFPQHLLAPQWLSFSSCANPLELTAAGLFRILTRFPLSPLAGEPKPAAKVQIKFYIQKKV